MGLAEFGEFGGEGTQQPGLEKSGFGILFTDIDQHGTKGNVRGCLIIYITLGQLRHVAFFHVRGIFRQEHIGIAQMFQTKKKWPSSRAHPDRAAGAHS
eukprot:scaffold20115_cov70-Attheya_sp.AAC.2